MARDLFLRFKEEGERLKELSPDRHYYLWEMDQLKEVIEQDLEEKKKDPVKKAFVLYLNGEQTVEGMFYFGKHTDLSVVDYIKLLVQEIDGNETEKEKFFKILDEKHNKELSLLESNHFEKFVVNCEVEMGDHQFSLKQLHEIFGELIKYYRPTTEIDKMVDYLRNCQKVCSFNYEESEFKYFVNFIKNYYKSIKITEYITISLEVPEYSKYMNLFQSPLIDPLEGMKQTEVLNEAIKNEAFKQMMSSNTPIEKREDFKEIVRSEVEKSIIEVSKESYVDDEILSELENIIGFKLRVSDTEYELENSFNSENFSELPDQQSDPLESQDEGNNNDMKIQIQNEEIDEKQAKAEVLFELFQAGQIKDILNLTEQEKELVKEELNKKSGNITKEELAAVYSKADIDPELISFLQGDKKSYNIRAEMDRLEDIAAGEVGLVFLEDENRGRSSAMYEMFKDNVHSFLLKYDEQKVNSILRQSVLEQNDLSIFKDWAAKAYVVFVAEIIMNGLDSKKS
ncbi:hypothetical protein [Bacillus sp. FSL M8-0168]|uniref:hypothetical protein n=1 Tax=Bacillus sp. FSL M8-0168 TaxID=2921614 RepID=UPI0030FDE1A3